MKKLLFICAAAACMFTPQVSANQPDSVYLFSYAEANGAGGLKLAWSPDAQNWTQLNSGNSVVNSDFGPWGRMKKCFRPHLVQTVSDGKWHCTWHLSADGDGMAYVDSPDLMYWNPQLYFPADKLSSYAPKGAVHPTKQIDAKIGSKTQTGYSQRVPYSLIEGLIRFSDQRAYRAAQYDERLQDVYALAPFEATLTVHTDSTKAISDKLIGIFFEDINYGADGGLYAELVQNRDFEYAPGDNHHAKWSPSTAWTALSGSDSVALSIDTVSPLHANNPHYALLPAGTAITNAGYDGIVLRKGERYRFSFFGRSAAKGASDIEVSLVGKDGKVLAQKKFKVSSKNWKKFSSTFVPSADADQASIRLAASGGEAAVDMISLFPVNTFKNRENGLRADLAQTLADLHPRFVRFPGGCVAHGDGIDNIYDWKGSVGPLESRKPLRNLWNYHQTRGLGYFEYFQFCEDIGAEPLPVLAAGVPCQNSGTPGHHSHDQVTSYGQQDGIPMDEMDEYIQDVLDLIEYANGDPRTSRWARMRAEAGHPKPFNLKYIGIGNEDMITEPFEKRFAMIADAVKARYPEVKIVGTVGPFYEGTDYTRGWEFATEQNLPLVDEHYYVSPGWMINNNHFYDSYDRSKPHVYLGEYAAHIPGRHSTLETALCEAAYLTGVERNGDVVEMTSYAPLLAKEGHTQWRPDLIYFNNTEIKPTTSYFVQQLYGQNSGDTYVNSTLDLSDKSAYAAKSVLASVLRGDTDDSYILKLVNLTPAEVDTHINLENVNLNGYKALQTQLSGDIASKDVKPVSSEYTVSNPGMKLNLPARSFTVIRLIKQ